MAEIVEIIDQDGVNLQRYNDTHFTKIKGNFEYTVLMPGEFFQRASAMESSCSTFLVNQLEFHFFTLFNAFIFTGYSSHIRLSTIHGCFPNVLVSF